jgi:hypothetical protein
MENSRSADKVRYFLRITWVVVQLVLVLWLAQGGSHFYYQGF